MMVSSIWLCPVKYFLMIGGRKGEIGWSRKDIIISVPGNKDSSTSTVPSRKDIILLVSVSDVLKYR
jgi:hypothetical protein